MYKSLSGQKRRCSPVNGARIPRTGRATWTGGYPRGTSLTPLIPDEKLSQVKEVRKHGHIVAVSSRPITQAQTRAYLDDFP